VFVGGTIVLLSVTTIPGVTVSGGGWFITVLWFIVATIVVAPVVTILILRYHDEAARKSSVTYVYFASNSFEREKEDYCAHMATKLLGANFILIRSRET
jgi:uncharacterized membrane protein YhaH (DUF805 family)